MNEEERSLLDNIKVEVWPNKRDSSILANVRLTIPVSPLLSISGFTLRTSKKGEVFLSAPAYSDRAQKNHPIVFFASKPFWHALSDKVATACEQSGSTEESVEEINLDDIPL